MNTSCKHRRAAFSGLKHYCDECSAEVFPAPGGGWTVTQPAPSAETPSEPVPTLGTPDIVIERWAMREVDGDPDCTIYDGMETDRSGDWVHYEDACLAVIAAIRATRSASTEGPSKIASGLFGLFQDGTIRTCGGCGDRTPNAFNDRGRILPCCRSCFDVVQMYHAAIIVISGNLEADARIVDVIEREHATLLQGVGFVLGAAAPPSVGDTHKRCDACDDTGFVVLGGGETSCPYCGETK